jgi:hypothetical protein
MTQTSLGYVALFLTVLLFQLSVLLGKAWLEPRIPQSRVCVDVFQQSKDKHKGGTLLTLTLRAK